MVRAPRLETGKYFLPREQSKEALILMAVFILSWVQGEKSSTTEWQGVTIALTDLKSGANLQPLPLGFLTGRMGVL